MFSEARLFKGAESPPFVLGAPGNFHVMRRVKLKPKRGSLALTVETTNDREIYVVKRVC